MDSAKRKSSHLVSVVALLVFLSLTSSGCTIIGSRYGEPIDVAHSRLEEGVTDVGQIVEWFGPPTHLSALPGGLVMVYEYLDITERQLGINLNVIGLDWFKVAFGRGSAMREGLVLVFDDAGSLRAKEFRRWTEDIGKGFGFQLFFAALPTVDKRHLTGPPEQFGWGRATLGTLPVTLNAGQSVDSGSHGIEMRGTPVSLGQRTLEMRTTGRKKKDSGN
jgi:hypothetical protein